MIQGMAMGEIALVAVVVAAAEVVDEDAGETVILGVMEVGTMSLALQGGALAQGTTMKGLRAHLVGSASQVAGEGVEEMIMVGEVAAAVHGVEAVEAVAAHGEMVEMAVGTHGEMGEVAVVGVGQISLRNWSPLSLMLVAGAGEVVVVGGGNKDEIFLFFPTFSPSSPLSSEI